MTAINQKEYLKKYLSNSSESSKKKKRKKKGTAISDRVKIIDDDIDVAIFNKAVEDDLQGEDAPQIVGIIDERPLELRIDDYRKSDLWTPVGIQNATTSESARVHEKNSDNSPHRIQRKVNSSANNESRWNSSNERSPPQGNESHRKFDFSSPKRNAACVDISPPRRHTNDATDTDFSPPRRYARSEMQSSLGKNKKFESDVSDRNYDKTMKYDRKFDECSPPRRKRDSDLNSSRRRRRDGDSSPSMRRRGSDSSPKRKRDNGSSSSRKRGNDSSPPRRRGDDSSPSRRRDNYSSPPRRRGDDSSLSRRRRDNDSSPPRKYQDNNNTFKNHVEYSHNRKRSYDRSSPRQHRRLSKDRSHGLSPSRKNKKYNEAKQDEIVRGSDTTNKNNLDNTKGTKTLDGKTAGLQNANELARETEVWKKREDELFKNMSTEISGKNATAIIRDRRTGKIRDFKKEAEEESKKKEKEAENQEKYARWGKGLKQVEEHDEKVSNELYEMSKPLARYADDEDLERYLKGQEREGDPMLDYIRKKKKKKQEIEQKPIKLQYEGEFMPNRYGIRPGYRWDGVDRSNGYERKWFEVINSRRACQEEVYKWSTEDM